MESLIALTTRDDQLLGKGAETLATVLADDDDWAEEGVVAARQIERRLDHAEVVADVRHTGGPGDIPMSCGDPANTGGAGCHTNSTTTGGPINSFGGSVSATFSTGSIYIPGGQPVTITVTVTDPASNWSG